MNDTDIFNSIVAQLRKESPDLPKGDSILDRGPLWLYGVLWALSFIFIVVSFKKFIYFFIIYKIIRIIIKIKIIK